MSHGSWNNGGRGSGKGSKTSFNPSSSSSGSSSSQVIFVGGSAYDFALAKQKLKNKFIENKCWSYVEMPPPLLGVVPGAVGVPAVAGIPHPAVPAAIIEDIFNVAKPEANQGIAQAMVQVEINEINAMCDQNQVEIYNMNIGHGVKNQMYFDNDKKRRELIYNANRSVVQVLERLLSAVTQWHKDKALHEEKVAACLKVFVTYLGPGPLSVINSDLNHMRFRAAWHKLCTRYSTNSGSRQSVSNIMSSLSNAVYVKNKTIQEHIEEMMLIANECTQVDGVAIPENLVLEYILTSIERSACASDFEEDVKAIRRFDYNLLKAQETLQTTQNNIASQRTVNKMKNKRARDQESGEQSKGHKEILAAATLIVQNNNKKPKVSKGDVVKNGTVVCKLCSKPHKGECWTTAICDKCNTVGHIARWCPTNLVKPESNNKNKLSLVGVFSKK